MNKKTKKMMHPINGDANEITQEFILKALQSLDLRAYILAEMADISRSTIHKILKNDTVSIDSKAKVVVAISEAMEYQFNLENLFNEVISCYKDGKCLVLTTASTQELANHTKEQHLYVPTVKKRKK